jgi:hypothetical protein
MVWRREFSPDVVLDAVNSQVLHLRVRAKEPPPLVLLTRGHCSKHAVKHGIENTLVY